jgi:hypothetical protein
MELLVDVGQVEARFCRFGDNVKLYRGYGNLFGHTRWTF